jgi:hypothetical protein
VVNLEELYAKARLPGENDQKIKNHRTIWER